jgi:uncharacterized membrane protein
MTQPAADNVIVSGRCTEASVTARPTELRTNHIALHHPAVVAELEKRASDAQLRIADKITAFAGSMRFVYLHALLFALWMLVFERSPWPTLTLIVSLEAIFLSTFVMIGQNRQASFQQTKADQDYADVSRLLLENTELTRAIHQLTQEVYRLVSADGRTTATPDDTPDPHDTHDKEERATGDTSS